MSLPTICYTCNLDYGFWILVYQKDIYRERRHNTETVYRVISQCKNCKARDDWTSYYDELNQAKIPIPNDEEIEVQTYDEH